MDRGLLRIDRHPQVRDPIHPWMLLTLAWWCLAVAAPRGEASLVPHAPACPGVRSGQGTPSSQTDGLTAGGTAEPSPWASQESHALYCRMLGGSKPSPSGEGFSVLGHSPGRNRGSSAVRPRSLFHTVEPRAASAGCLIEPGSLVMWSAWDEVDRSGAETWSG